MHNLRVIYAYYYIRILLRTLVYSLITGELAESQLLSSHEHSYLLDNGNYRKDLTVANTAGCGSTPHSIGLTCPSRLTRRTHNTAIGTVVHYNRTWSHTIVTSYRTIMTRLTTAGLRLNSYLQQHKVLYTTDVKRSIELHSH